MLQNNLLMAATTVEDRADAADAVEVLRQAVKTRFPVPE